VKGSCEQGNESSGSTKFLEIVEKLSDLQILEKDFAP
jgi:hypothetical protein